MPLKLVNPKSVQAALVRPASVASNDSQKSSRPATRTKGKGYGLQVRGKVIAVHDAKTYKQLGSVKAATRELSQPYEFDVKLDLSTVMISGAISGTPLEPAYLEYESQVALAKEKKTDPTKPANDQITSVAATIAAATPQDAAVAAQKAEEERALLESLKTNMPTHVQRFYDGQVITVKPFTSSDDIGPGSIVVIDGLRGNWSLNPTKPNKKVYFNCGDVTKVDEGSSSLCYYNMNLANMLANEMQNAVVPWIDLLHYAEKEDGPVELRHLNQRELLLVSMVTTPPEVAELNRPNTVVTLRHSVSSKCEIGKSEKGPFLKLGLMAWGQKLGKTPEDPPTPWTVFVDLFRGAVSQVFGCSDPVLINTLEWLVPFMNIVVSGTINPDSTSGIEYNKGASASGVGASIFGKSVFTNLDEVVLNFGIPIPDDLLDAWFGGAASKTLARMYTGKPSLEYDLPDSAKMGVINITEKKDMSRYMKLFYMLTTHASLGRIAKALATECPTLLDLHSYSEEDAAALLEMGASDYPSHWVSVKPGVDICTSVPYKEALLKILSNKEYLEAFPSFFYVKSSEKIEFSPELYDAAAYAERFSALQSHVFHACGKEWPPKVADPPKAEDPPKTDEPPKTDQPADPNAATKRPADDMPPPPENKAPRVDEYEDWPMDES
jgi:hypothetical protein